MDTLYTARIHGFPPASIIGNVSHGGIDAITQESVLSLVVVLGSSVSLVALVFAFITYSLFSDLRSLAGTALINLLAALFMAQLLYVIGVGGVEDSELCMALSFSLQYMRLTVFCWLTAMTYDMYCTFRDNVSLLAATPDATTLGSSFLKYSLFGWGAPLVSLAASIVLQLRARGSLMNTEGLHESNCWFLDDIPCVYAFAIPATALLITNVVYLIKAAVIARYTVGLQLEKRVREKMARRRRLQMWLFARVAIFVGLVSALGVTARLTHSPTLWAAFNVGSGLQGLVVALSVTCNCKVLKIYTRSLRRSGQNGSAFPGALKGAGGYGGTASEVAKSTSLQMLTWEPTPDAV